MVPITYQIKKLVYKRYQRKHLAERLSYLPTKVAIETGNICNLKCPLCPTGNEKEKVGKGLLSYTNFVRIIDQLGPTAHHLDLFNWGEPVLNKDLVRMIRYSKKRYRHLFITTSCNLNILPDEMAEGMVTAGLDKLVCSVDGVTQESYQKYRVGGVLSVVLENMKKLVRYKREHKKGRPQILWNFLVFSHNMHEVDEVRRLAAEIGVSVNIAGMRTDCGQEIYKTFDERMAEDSSWIPTGSEFNKYTSQRLAERVKICERPWYNVMVNWDGCVAPCGSIYDVQKHAYGNMLQEPFTKIWNNDKYRAARREIAGRPPSGPDTICRTCKKNGFPLYE